MASNTECTKYGHLWNVYEIMSVMKKETTLKNENQMPSLCMNKKKNIKKSRIIEP